MDSGFPFEVAGLSARLELRGLAASSRSRLPDWLSSALDQQEDAEGDDARGRASQSRDCL